MAVILEAEPLEPGEPPHFPAAPWLPYLLPIMVFMLSGSLEPTEEAPNWLGLTRADYPWVYALRLLATAAALAWSAPAWRRFPLRVSPLAVVVGVVGVVVWVGVCALGVEDRIVEALGPESDAVGLLGLGARPGYNPFEEIENPASAWGFLAVRFVGLALLVPLLEELMLRGWLMRSIVSPEFWRVPFGRLTVGAAIAGTAFPMLYHPEKLASLAWFSLVTWLMARTKNFWDCVVAHAVTNFLLGVWVVWQGDWRLW